MKAGIIKHVHPLLFFGILFFLAPFFLLPNGLADLSVANQGGPCGSPVFLLFVPGGFMILLGLGFSAIRVLEWRAWKRKAAAKRSD